MYIQVVLYLLFRLQLGRSKFYHWKWTTNSKGFILHVFSLDKLQWNEKGLFSRSIQMFILATVIANEQYTNHPSVNKRCWVTKQKNVNLTFGHCCCFSHPIHLVSGSFYDHGRYICMSVVREKSLEQIHNNEQPFPFTFFMTDRCSLHVKWKMDVIFRIMDVTMCKKDKEISDVKNVNSLYLLFFPQTLENWPLVLK